MSLFKTLLAGGVIAVALSSPDVRTGLRDTTIDLLGPPASASAHTSTRQQVCDLARLWSTTHGETRDTTARILLTIARDEHTTASSPAKQALLDDVPRAYQATGTPQSVAARAAIARRCARAHD